MKEKLEQQFEDLLTELEEFRNLNETLDNIKDINDGVVKASKKLLEDFETNVERFDKTAQDLLKSYEKRLKELDGLFNHLTNLGSQLGSFIQELKDRIKDLGEETTQLIITFKKSIDRLLEESKNILKQIAVSVLEDIKKEIRYEFDVLREEVNNQIEVIKKKQDELNEQYIDLFQNLQLLVKEVKQDQEKFIEDTKAMLEHYFSSVSKLLEEFQQVILQEIRREIQNLHDHIRDFTASLKRELQILNHQLSEGLEKLDQELIAVKMEQQLTKEAINGLALRLNNTESWQRNTFFTILVLGLIAISFLSFFVYRVL